WPRVMRLGERGVGTRSARHRGDGGRRVVCEVTRAASIVGMMLLIWALRASIPPPVELLVLVLVGAGLLCALSWRWFIRVHARLQAALVQSFDTAAHS